MVVSQDARYRVKYLLDTWLAAASITKDDDTTYASYIVAFSDPQYPMKKVFHAPKNRDGIFSIQPFDSEPLIGWDHKAYAYRERVPIEILTMDKVGVTAVKLENKMAHQLRSIFESYCTNSTSSSLRTISRIRHGVKDMGGWSLYSALYIVDWTRVQSDSTPSYPTVSYGDDWIYEGDRTSGGTEGTWTETEDGVTGSFAVNQSTRNIVLTASALAGNEAYYISNGTNLAMSSTTYTTMRWRFKTSSTTIKARIDIEFSDASTQTILADSSSTGGEWIMGSGTITTGKTIDHVRLHADHAASGTVTYDFVSIDKGNYIFPNVVNLTAGLVSNDAVLIMPGYMGTLSQPLGSQSAEIRMTCNLDMDLNSTTLAASILTWRRPQTAALASKTDYNHADALLELWHYGGNTHLWHWFDLGPGSLVSPTSPLTMKFKARLVDLNIRYTGATTFVDMVWREYRHGSADETLNERFGLNL